MDYHRIHDKIIINAILRGKPIGYYEKHHIIPKSFYSGKYASFKSYPWNLVLLTAKEHFIVHKLLVKMYKNKDDDKHRKMVYALRMMSKPCSINNNRIKMTAFNYEFIKKQMSLIKMTTEQRIKISNSHKGKVISDTHKASISSSLKNRIPWNKGKKTSEETKQKISFATTGEKNPFFGKSHSEMSKQKNRLSNLGKHFKPHTEETKQKISLSKKGANNPNFGKPATNKGRAHTEETKQKMRMKALARNRACTGTVCELVDLTQ